MTTPPKKRRPHWKKQVVPILTSSIPDKVWADGDPKLLGYARVSTSDQDTQRQVDELVLAGVAAIDVFSDKGTGAHMDRPGWELVMKKLEAGDVLVIHSLDRMSRDLVHTMTALQGLNERGITVRVLTMDFDSRTPMGRFVFAMMAAFAQFEREVMNERTAHGLAKARARGRIGGASVKYPDDVIAAAYAAAGTIPKTAKKLGCSEITVKRGLARMRAKEKADAE